jgi:hypothetical protein
VLLATDIAVDQALARSAASDCVSALPSIQKREAGSAGGYLAFRSLAQV